MNIYLISQNQNTGYDTFDRCVVVAESELDAKLIHPYQDQDYYESLADIWNSDTWCASPNEVKVELLGIAADNIKQGIILKSFNAG